VSEELHGKNFSDKLVWVAGLYYYHESFELSPTSYATQALPPQPPGIPLFAVGVPTTTNDPASQIITNSTAAYFNATYHLFDKFSLLGGFRSSDEVKNVQTVGFATAMGIFPAIPGSLAFSINLPTPS
jgi:hypothetical protein